MSPTTAAPTADYEYVPVRIPPGTDRVTAAVQLSLHAEYGGWELAKVQRYLDGTRRAVLRRKRRRGEPEDSLPLPGIIR